MTYFLLFKATTAFLSLKIQNWNGGKTVVSHLSKRKYCILQISGITAILFFWLWNKGSSEHLMFKCQMKSFWNLISFISIFLLHRLMKIIWKWKRFYRWYRDLFTLDIATGYEEQCSVPGVSHTEKDNRIYGMSESALLISWWNFNKSMWLTDWDRLSQCLSSLLAVHQLTQLWQSRDVDVVFK